MWVLQPFFIVVELFTWISWLENHWGKSYISMAKNIILDLLNINTLVSTSTDHPNQMWQYLSHLLQESPSESQHHTLENFSAICYIKKVFASMGLDLSWGKYSQRDTMSSRVLLIETGSKAVSKGETWMWQAILWLHSISIKK